jgi:arsenate reductase
VFDWELARQMDVVVTVCSHANESCPVLPPEVRRLHWPLEDPAAAQGSEDAILATFRTVRDQVEVLMHGLVRDLV